MHRLLKATLAKDAVTGCTFPSAAVEEALVWMQSVRTSDRCCMNVFGRSPVVSYWDRL